MSDYSQVKCGICGVSWDEHDTDPNACKWQSRPRGGKDGGNLAESLPRDVASAVASNLPFGERKPLNSVHKDSEKSGESREDFY